MPRSRLGPSAAPRVWTRFEPSNACCIAVPSKTGADSRSGSGARARGVERLRYWRTGPPPVIATLRAWPGIDWMELYDAAAETGSPDDRSHPIPAGLNPVEELPGVRMRPGLHRVVKSTPQFRTRVDRLYRSLAPQAHAEQEGGIAVPRRVVPARKEKEGG